VWLLALLDLLSGFGLWVKLHLNRLRIGSPNTPSMLWRRSSNNEHKWGQGYEPSSPEICGHHQEGYGADEGESHTNEDRLHAPVSFPAYLAKISSDDNLK